MSVPNTTVIEIDLRGQGNFPDVPPIPDRLACKFELVVYTGGEDSVCINLREYKMWEGWETVLVLDILKTGSGRNELVLDVGSHVGWYSIIAAKCGHTVFAYDESQERVDMLNEGAKLNQCERSITANCVRIDGYLPPSIFEGEILLFKSDIEGQDPCAVKNIFDLFAEKRIKYALIEISPCFSSGYPEMVQSIVDCGYNVYCIPEKGFDKRIEFGAYPLQTLKENCKIDGNYADFIKTFQQKNFLFIKQ